MTAQAPPGLSVHIREHGGRCYLRFGGERFDEALADLRRSFPRHGDRVWLAGERCWSLPSHHRGALAAWATMWDPDFTWAYGPHFEARQTHQQRRAGGSHGRSEAGAGQQGQGNRRSRTGSTGPIGKSTSLAHAYQVLHLRKSAPVPLVRAARRALATLHHSDHHRGGDEAMAGINAAADAILAALAAPTEEFVPF